MKNQQTDNRVRPSFLILLACALAAMLIPLGLHLTRSSRAVAPAESAAPAKLILAAPAAQPAETAAVPLSPVEQRWGIQLTSVGLTRSDSALDLRYRVTAPEKAAALAESTNMAFLVHQASSTAISITPPRQEDAQHPRSHSQARSLALMMPRATTFPPPPSRLTPGRTYSILLLNPGGAVKSGHQVAMVVGDTWTGDLIVGQSQVASNETLNK